MEPTSGACEAILFSTGLRRRNFAWLILGYVLPLAILDALTCLFWSVLIPTVWSVFYHVAPAAIGLLVVALSLNAVCLARLLSLKLYYSKTIFIITDQRVVIRSPRLVLSKEGIQPVEIAYNQLSEAMFQPMPGGSGILVLSTRDGEVLTFTDVDQAGEFAQVLNEAVRLSRGGCSRDLLSKVGLIARQRKAAAVVFGQ